MIGGIGRHGRTKRDAKNLASHLLKDRGAAVEVINSAAPDLRAAMGDMQLARDASRADSAFLHAYLSPSRDMSRDELRQAAEIVLKHFGAEDHQAALVFHDKPRRGGEGNSHVHIVVGRVGPDGDVIASGFEKIRMETAVRLAEFELGEAPTLGRHQASAVRWMRQNGRSDAADWLEGIHGPAPAKPHSMTTPEARQGMERRGVVPGTVRETVLAAWTASDSPRAFGAAMAAEGIQIAPGSKPGVFVVSVDGIEVGALDRIVKQKRRDVAERMKGFDHVAGAAAAAEGPRPEGTGDLQTRGADLSQGAGSAPASEAPGRTGAEGGRPDRGHPDPAGNDRDQPASAAPVVGGPSREGRRLEQAQAVRQLSQVRLSPATVQAMQAIRLREVSGPSTRFESLQASRAIEASTGWDRLRDLGERLLDRCRQTYDQVLRFRAEQQAERKREEAAAAARRWQPPPELDLDDYDEPEYVYSGPRM